MKNFELMIDYVFFDWVRKHIPELICGSNINIEGMVVLQNKFTMKVWTNLIILYVLFSRDL